MEVCPLSRGMMLPTPARLNPCPTDYRPAFASSILPYPQSHRLRLRSAFPVLTHEGDYGLTMFRKNDRIGLGPLCSPVAGKAHSSHAHDGGDESPRAHHIAVWPRPDSIFGLLRMTTFIESSHVLAMPSTLAPCRLMLAATPSPHGSDARLAPAGYVVAG